MLGGSSSINGLIYIRGQKQDYDLWRQLGNTGWSYDDVLPYFRKAEDQSAARTSPRRGRPARRSPICAPTSLRDVFVEAASRPAIRCNADFNGAEQEGVGPSR